MAINNVYNQTPKRIFTNKPFVKGMSYTNADMAPYVCRSVANLDMESSSTATHIRQGIYNKKVYEDAEVLRFFDKYLVIPNVSTELAYRNGTSYIEYYNPNERGIKIISSDFETEYDVYPSIVYNDTAIIYNNALSHEGNTLNTVTASTAIFSILKLNNGTVPFAINSNNKSLSFFGSIHATDGDGPRYYRTLYTGLITIYFHSVANTAIVEIINPTIANPEDVMNYGSNILAKNPLIYRDYVSIPGGIDTYLDYASNVSDKLIDITTLQVYDTSVDPVGLTTNSTANLVNGFNKDTQDDVYIRPYVVLPKGNYSATLKANIPGDANKEYYYNFQAGNFVNNPTSEKLIEDEIGDGNIEATLTTNPAYVDSIKNFYISADTESDDSQLKVVFDSVDRNTYSLFSTLPYESSVPYNINDLNNQCKSIRITNAPVETVYDLLNLYSSGNSWSYIFSDNVGITSDLTTQTGYEAEHVGNVGTIMPVSQIKVYPQKMTANIDLSEGSATTTTPVNIKVKTDFYRTDAINGFNYHTNTPTALGLAITPSILYNSDGSAANSFTGTFTINHVGSSDTLRWLNNTDITANGTNTFSTTLPSLGVSIYCTALYNQGRTFNGRTEYTCEVTCDVTVTDWNKLKTYFDEHGGRTCVIKCIRHYPSQRPHTTIEYDVTSTITGALKYTISQEVNKVSVSADINADLFNSYLPWGNIGALCSKVYFGSAYKDAYNGGVIDFINSSYPLTYIARNAYGIDTPPTYKDISITFPHTSLFEKRRKLVVSDSYIQHIQTIDTNGNMNVNYNLRLPCSSITTIPKMSDSGAITFIVSIFPTTEENIIDSPDAVSATSAIIKTYEDDIIKYDTLINETNFKSGVNNIATHLGYYVFWGKETKSNTLFYSEFNNPAYIPSMYMIDFDKPIVHVHPHQGNLIVFTTDDIHMLHSGNVPSTVVQDGSEIPFTKSLIQANTRLGYANINTVSSIGKDVFFITEHGDGYLLKTNRYVSDASDTYLIKITHQIEDLLKNPFEYCRSRADSFGYPLSPSKSKPFIYSSPSAFYGTSIDNIIDQNAAWNYQMANKGTIEVIDGDTFKYNNTVFRLADVNTPELASNERLAINAKKVLDNLLNYNDDCIYIFYKDDLIDPYGRYIANVITTNESMQSFRITYINKELLRIGIANPYMLTAHTKYFVVQFSEHGGPSFAPRYLNMAVNEAISNNLGVYNNINYNDSISVGEENYPLYDAETYHLNVYTTNNYIYIVQTIFVNTMGTGITIIYKYSIDNRTWITYDFWGTVCPVDIVSDNTKTGFAMLCNNRGKSFINQIFSVLTFSNSLKDINEVTKTNDNIHAYFDTGNQGISIMNEKLFREFKLSLGSSDSSNLDIDYKIKVFIDGKEITGRDKHLKGKQEADNGFKKITLLTPCRGRIPRYTVDIECKSDVNILEYAIVYLQLNAK